MVKQVVARKAKKNFKSFSLYIYKVLKTISGDTGISQKGMKVVNSLVVDLFEQIALESSKLVRYNNKRTLSSTDVQAAVKLLLTDDLAQHANMEAGKALQKFNSAK